MKKYTKQILYTLTIMVFIAFIIVISPKAMQNDTFWSIEVGEKIVKEEFRKGYKIGNKVIRHAMVVVAN